MKLQRAIKSKPVTPIEILERLHAYREASRPFLKILSDLGKTQVTKMLLYRDGRFEIKYTDKYYTLKKQIDQTLDCLHKEIFGTPDYNKEYWRKYGISSTSLNPITGNLRL